MKFSRLESKISVGELKAKWLQLQQLPNVFAYRLSVTHSRRLGGECSFYAELNPERSSLRRPPQVIASLNPAFDEHKFNFNKISPLELITTIPYGGGEVALIINKSPLTTFHTLICPDVRANHAQRLTWTALSFCVAFMWQLEERDIRIGYNSPGALASVNHLHLHLIDVPIDLYVDRAKLTLLADTYIYRLDRAMPTEAICFCVYNGDSDAQIEAKLRRLYDFIMWLCERNMPHNLFVTADRTGARNDGPIKIFVYAREQYCIIKDLTSYNIGFCELSGYIPLGEEKCFDTITEDDITARIRDEVGAAYPPIYSYFTSPRQGTERNFSLPPI